MTTKSTNESILHALKHTIEAGMHNFIDEDENIPEDVINSIVRLHLDLELYFKINTLNGV